ncbi:putative secreted protein [Talaromyces pinophilus]|nr:putative secreted protein [Talaromyces pinophilus]
MRSLWMAVALLTGALAQSTTTSSSSSTTSASDTDTTAIVTISGTVDPLSIDGATGSVTYHSVTTTVTLSTDSNTLSGTVTRNATDVYTTTSGTVTVLVGSQGTTTLAPNATASRNGTTATMTTSTAPLPTNTQPCNGYVEFCARNYSNITYVAAHNSPFDRQGNIASNQQYSVTTQLNDGIRMLQFQVHFQNDTLYLCHTSCDLLNAGTLQDYLTTVTKWLNNNPYEVITILMGNYDLVSVGNFTDSIVNSGLSKYAYQPPKIPMGLDDWPVLSELILTQKRAIIFMDYNANQTEVPYILDEFTQMWETPFSPTDSDFPCTTQRPPNLSEESAKSIMYMANHNLNVEISFSGFDILIPNTAVLNETNGVSGYRSLGLMADNCTATWGRPPNFLLVDYYNDGSFPGSVFEVAADMNNVTYNGHCCGSTSGALRLQIPDHQMFVMAVVVFLFF